MEEIELLCFEAKLEVAALLRQRFNKVKLKTTVVSHPLDGLKLVEDGRFDLVILDYDLPEINGLEVLERIQLIAPNLPIVFATHFSDTKIAVEAIKKGALDYIAKGETDVFLRKIEHNLQDWLHIHDAKINQLNLIADLKNYAQTVAHDLKNPLSTLKALTSLLSIDENNEVEITKYASAIATTVDKMRGIVDELLLMASTKKEDVEFKALNTHQLVTSAVDRLDYLIKDRSATVKVIDSFPAAMGYPAWVEEIWVNFISNALKYGGPAPQIEIDADILSDGRIRFWVIDNGPGVPLEKQQDLFKPLAKLDYGKTNGHGLGLSIVKRIAEKLNGEVGLFSRDGEGARFYFVLPADATQQMIESYKDNDHTRYHKAS
ncbi:MAG: ATP-binding protein [Bacteroidia bacterium]